MKKLEAEPRTTATFMFAGIAITPLCDGVNCLEQPSYAYLDRLSADATFDQYHSLRSQLVLLEQTRPDLVSTDFQSVDTISGLVCYSVAARR